MTQQVKETKSVIDQIKTKLTKKINQETKPKQNANWGIKQKKKKKKKKNQTNKLMKKRKKNKKKNRKAKLNRSM